MLTSLHTNLNILRAAMSTLNYPIGPCVTLKPETPEQLIDWRNDIAAFPAQVRQAINPLNKEALQWIYRPEGWTIHQVIHHCADSHMNAYIRFKLALTEESPQIKPYLEAKWAELPDTLTIDIEASLMLLEGLHARWTHLLDHLTPSDLSRTFTHPEMNETLRLDETMSIYSWHCRHHLAHIHQAIAHQGKF